MPRKSSSWYAPLTPLSFLRRIAYVMPDKTAVVHGDKSWTWQEFLSRVTRLSNALKAAGVKKGDRVAFLSRNFPPLLEGHHGIPLAGAAIVAINYRLSAPEVTTIVNRCGAKVFIVDCGVAELVRPKEMPGVTVYVNVRDAQSCGETAGKGLPGVDYEDFIGRASDEYIEPELDENEPIAIDYTSGTTGLPKGCLYSHRSAYLNALAEIIDHSLNAYSMYLWTLPMFHCNGWCFTWATSGVGATNICLRAPEPAEIWKLIEREGITHMAGAPIVFHRLGAFLDEKGIGNFPRKVIITIAASPPTEYVIRAMESRGGEIRHVYGLTETYGPFTLCEWQPRWDGLTLEERVSIKMRQGVPDITAGEARIIDTSGKDVPWDGETMGEVLLRGNNVIQGYYQAPKENAKAFGEGWLHTGDAGIVHPDGYIELKDRFKDIIISGGENIVGLEVENCLYQHPGVAEVACYGMPDGEWGEIVKCLVTPKSGASATARELTDFCRERLTHFKCPKEIEFGEIPRTSSGKVKKYLLRQREKERFEKRKSAPTT